MTRSTTRDPLPGVLLALTATTGLVDAVSYLGLGHVFTANVTGNIVLLGFALVQTPGFSILATLISVGGFLCGAVAGGRLARTLAPRSHRRWFVVAIAAETGLLLAAALAAYGLPGSAWTHQYSVVIAFMAAAMGLRNATARSLALPDLTTTVLTLTLTGLAADSSLAGGTNPRFARRAGSVLALLSGAGIGALLARHSLTMTLLITAACVLAAAFTYAMHPASAQKAPA